MKIPMLSAQAKTDLELLSQWMRAQGHSSLTGSIHRDNDWAYAAAFAPGWELAFTRDPEWCAWHANNAPVSPKLSGAVQAQLGSCLDWCEYDARSLAGIGIKRKASFGGEFRLIIDADQRLLSCDLQGLFVGISRSRATIKGKDSEELQQLLVELKVLGRQTFNLSFSGGGDEGYVEGAMYLVKPGSPAYQAMQEGRLESTHEGQIASQMEEWCNEQLTDLFGGWYINDGSKGQIKFDVPRGICGFSIMMPGKSRSASAAIALNF